MRPASASASARWLSTNTATSTADWRTFNGERAVLLAPVRIIEVDVVSGVSETRHERVVLIAIRPVLNKRRMESDRWHRRRLRGHLDDERLVDLVHDDERVEDRATTVLPGERLPFLLAAVLLPLNQVDDLAPVDNQRVE